MVARIEHERAEREALEQQRQELLKRKAKLIAENKRRKDDLANLDKDLERFIDVSFGFPFPYSFFLFFLRLSDSLGLRRVDRLRNPFRSALRRLSEGLLWLGISYFRQSLVCWHAIPIRTA
jgi:hypothetical protein